VKLGLILGESIKALQHWECRRKHSGGGTEEANHSIQRVYMFGFTDRECAMMVKVGDHLFGHRVSDIVVGVEKRTSNNNDEHHHTEQDDGTQMVSPESSLPGNAAKTNNDDVAAGQPPSSEQLKSAEHDVTPPLPPTDDTTIINRN
jgi:hypothetical protein